MLVSYKPLALASAQPRATGSRGARGVYLCLSIAGGGSPHLSDSRTAQNWSISGLGHLIGFHVFCAGSRHRSWRRRRTGSATSQSSQAEARESLLERGVCAELRADNRALSARRGPKACSAERRALRPRDVKLVEGHAVDGPRVGRRARSGRAARLVPLSASTPRPSRHGHRPQATSRDEDDDAMLVGQEEFPKM